MSNVFFRHLMLATYKQNAHKFVSDRDVCKIYDVEPSRINRCRTQLIEEGHSFVFMTEVMKTNGVRMVYKYLGQTNLGLVCVDDTKEPIDGEVLSRLRYRMHSSTMCNLLEALVPLNTKAYWTFHQLSQATGLDIENVKAQVANLVKRYDLIVHHREHISDRQHRITGIKLPSTIAASTAPKDHSLLNKVFQ